MANDFTQDPFQAALGSSQRDSSANDLYNYTLGQAGYGTDHYQRPSQDQWASWAQQQGLTGDQANRLASNWYGYGGPRNADTFRHVYQTTMMDPGFSRPMVPGGLDRTGAGSANFIGPMGNGMPTPSAGGQSVMMPEIAYYRPDGVYNAAGQKIRSWGPGEGPMGPGGLDRTGAGGAPFPGTGGYPSTGGVWNPTRPPTDPVSSGGPINGAPFMPPGAPTAPPSPTTGVSQPGPGGPPPAPTDGTYPIDPGRIDRTVPINAGAANMDPQTRQFQQQVAQARQSGQPIDWSHLNNSQLRWAGYGTQNYQRPDPGTWAQRAQQIAGLSSQEADTLAKVWYAWPGAHDQDTFNRLANAVVARVRPQPLPMPLAKVS